MTHHLGVIVKSVIPEDDTVAYVCGCSSMPPVIVTPLLTLPPDEPIASIVSASIVMISPTVTPESEILQSPTAILPLSADILNFIIGFAGNDVGL